MRKVTVSMIFWILLGMGAESMAAQEVVILTCRVTGNGFVSRPVEVDGCSKSGGVGPACPVIPGASCAQTLADFLSVSGFEIKTTQGYLGDGVIYTLEKK
ncbi:MAG: hypothetical protein IDH49_11400 [Gammaproteobacteria bacterium]|nr:hypothetical protein [Gammaproteobacteria bacterium]